MTYATVVADPPWQQQRGGEYEWRRGGPRAQSHLKDSRQLDYQTMSVAEIAGLGVREVAADDAHLFLWTTGTFLEASYGVVRAWGFGVSQTLVWAKDPHGWGPGGVFQATCEFIIYGRRGRPLPNRHTVDRQCFTWPRPEKAGHSAKPDAFMDMIERHFPAPRLELFARRARLGWDVAGDQSLATAEVPGISSIARRA